MHEWEELETTSHTTTDRMKVPGGWLYRTIVTAWIVDDGFGNGEARAATVSMVFVPGRK